MFRYTRYVPQRAFVLHSRLNAQNIRFLGTVGRKCFIRRNVAEISQPTTVSLRNASVFSGWEGRDWRQNDFLKDKTVKEKEAWLESMISSQWEEVDVEAFLVVLKALASHGLEDAGAPRRAEYWMTRLKNHGSLKPTAECYQAAIQAWANSNKDDILVVVNRSERWLNELIAESEVSSSGVKPTIECYNAFLDACTRGRPGRNKRNQSIVENNAVRAEAVLRRLHSRHHHLGEHAEVIPNTDTFNFVIRGWTRCKHDEIIAKRVLSLLRLMETYQRENPTSSLVLPNTKSYSMSMDALVSVAKMKARRCLQEGSCFKDDPSINGVNELNEAEAILNYMHDLYDGGVVGVVPHRIPYNILITGWAAVAGFGHANAPFKAEEIIRKMLSHKDKGFEEAAPDRISFEKVRLLKIKLFQCIQILPLTGYFHCQIISSWANSGHPNAGKRANWWLQKMWDDSELDGNSKMLPTKTTYNLVMSAVSEAEGALEAENLLLALGDKYKEEKEPELCPNSESFAIVIRAWLKKVEHDSNIADRVQSLSRAGEWLTSLREVENEKNLSTAPELFIGVLRAATKCARGRRKTLDLATDTFQGLRDSRFHHDTIPYCLLLQVGLDALSDGEGEDAARERKWLVEDLFSKCCEDGLVSNIFLQTLARSRTYETGWTDDERQDVIDQLLPDWPLPKSWSRNLSSQRFLPKATDGVCYTKRWHSNRKS